MVRLEIEADTVTLHFSCNEIFWGALCCCGNFSCPISSIKAVRVFDNFWTELRGLKVGTGLPFVVFLCSRYHSEGKDLWAYYGKEPGLVIEFENQSYKKWCLTVENAVE